MEDYKAIKNRQMELMLKPARERLKKYTIEELCRKGQIKYDTENGTFLFPSMGRIIEIKYPEFAIKKELDMWHHLTVLQYMDIADGRALPDDRGGRWSWSSSRTADYKRTA